MLVVGRWSLVVRHWSFVIGRSSLVVRHWSFVTGRSSLVVRHWSFVTGRSSLVVRCEEREPSPYARWESGELRGRADVPEAARERLG
jgi:hypothetical protein